MHAEKARPIHSGGTRPERGIRPRAKWPLRRDERTIPLAFSHELVIDNFAGGGGTSTGLERALGRPVDIAINHDPEALAMHAINHPRTKHLLESVWAVNPLKVTGNQPVGLVWLSPDCKHFSKAKGGTPVSKNIRGLAWVGLRWIALCKPRVLVMENVSEILSWGGLIIGPDGTARPDPAKKGKTFESFVRQIRAHGYAVEWRELRACDHGAPTIRKRLFLVARRDGLPICWPDATHADPSSEDALAGVLKPWRSAAECIDFDLPSQSVFDRKRPLVTNTMRRVAKGLWRHVLTSPKPFIVANGGSLAPSSGSSVDLAQSAGEQRATSFLASDRDAASNQPNIHSSHLAVEAPVIAPLRGTSESHLHGTGVSEPLSTISAGGTHHGLASASLVSIGYGERQGQAPRALDITQPLGTVVSGGVKHALVESAFAAVAVDPSEPGAGGPLPSDLVAASLVDMGHGESAATGAKRWSHGVRSLEQPLNTITASGGTSAVSAVHLTHLTHHGERSGNDAREPLRTITGAHRGEQAMVAACLEQAYGGFYEDNFGRPADAPMSTILSKGANQRLISAYCVKYYSNGGQWQGLAEPMHTLPTKGRMGLVQAIKVPVECLAPELRDRARQCAELLHEHLPEHFPEKADLIIVGDWVLVDITLRMLKAPELFLAQSFPADYIINEIPDPALLFLDGVQAADPLAVPRIPLSATAQVRMCGNSVAPAQAEALVRANFMHEDFMYGRMAA